MDLVTIVLYDGFKLRQSPTQDTNIMLNVTKRFCGFRTAFMVDSTMDGLADIIAEGELYDRMKNVELPDGWAWFGEDISGAAGYVVTFSIDHIPTDDDMLAIAAIMDDLNSTKIDEQWVYENIFNEEEFQNWSVYDVTNDMIKIAREMWNNGNHIYSNITEEMGCDSKLSMDSTPWNVTKMKGSKERLAKALGKAL